MSSKLRITRILKHTSQYALAIISGVFQPRISLIENDLAKPTEEEMKKLAKSLGVKVEYIFPTEEANHDD